MSDVTEGVGGIVEGALLGGAVETEGVVTSSDKRPEGACLNCGAQIDGPYCRHCGQKAHVHRTLSAIGHDLLHGVLHLDGKLWQTLPLLIFRPGPLTRRYIEGERAKFVSPMAMFLFSVFAMFAVFQMLGISAPSDLNPNLNVAETAEQLREQGAAEAGRLEAEIAELPEDDPSRAELQRELDVLSRTLEGSSSAAKIPPLGSKEWDINITGIKAIDEGIVKKWNENPGLVLYKMQANAYKFSWLLIPLSIPFVWLTFAWRRRFRAYDHAIFVTYSLSFMSLLFIALSVLGAVGAPMPLLVLSGMLIPPIHIYKQLRGTYEIGRFSAFWRLLALSVFIWIVIILFLQTLAVLGAF